jgi:tetratricopeptide (TPR) repeat protein/TolB-like protein
VIGETVSHYKILEELGSGGMGVVFKAEDTRLKRLVALKFLPHDLTRDPNAKRRFINEAQLTSSLDHPNICTIYEIDETKDGQLFISMACYQGLTLKQHLEQGPLKLEEAIKITIQIAQALTKTHSKGIIHRDIKPANIFITDEGQVKLLDFGLAKLAHQSKVTKTGTTVGTVAYMSPEQARGEEIDSDSDIWSLGVVLYEMITGQLPFKGENWEAVLYAILHQSPQPIRQIRPEVPEELQLSVYKMMNRDMDQRYENAASLITDLKLLGLHTDVAIEIDRLDQRLVKIYKWTKIRKIPWLVPLISLILITFIVIVVLIFQKAPVLKREPITVMSFKNLTGEDRFEYFTEVIPNLLITNLEQSEYLHLMTRERMNDLLKQMGREDIEEIDNELGFELCKMDGIKTIVLGSFTKAGNLFAVDVKMLDVDTKDLLHSISSKGKGVESILEHQIDELSIGISKGVGLTDDQITTSKLGIADVTTSSMDAYNYFLRGRSDYEKRYYNDARRFLEKAIELDSLFASAYLYLAWTHESLVNINKSDSALKKAKMLSPAASEKEKLYIEASYASVFGKDPQKRISILNELANKYPKEKRVYFFLASFYQREEMYSKALQELNKALKLDPTYGNAINLLAYIHTDLGDYNTAIEYFQKYSTLSPGDAKPFDSIAELFLVMGHLDKSITKFKEALEVKPDFGVEWKISYIYALKENYSEAIKWIDKFVENAPAPALKARGYLWKAFYHYWLGNMDHAHQAILIAIENYTQAGYMWGKFAMDLFSALIYLKLEEFDQSRMQFKIWHDWISEHDPYQIPWRTAFYNFCLGLIDLEEGKIDSAESRLSKIKSLIPQISRGKDYIPYRYNLLQGEILLKKGLTDKTIAICKNLPLPESFEFIHANLVLYNTPVPRDLLGRAYYQKGDMEKAIAEYERLVKFDAKSQNRFLVYPKYHYELARLYEKEGDRDLAMIQYKIFIELWKNTDIGKEELSDAKQRVLKLSGEKN